jgi:hypothetical protein
LTRGWTIAASGSAPSARGEWWSVTITSIPSDRASATSSTAVIAQSTVISSCVPRAASFSTVERASPYPSSTRLGRYQSTSAPSVRSARTRIAVEQMPSTS